MKKNYMSLGKFEPQKKKDFYHTFDPSLTLQAYLKPFDHRVVGGLH